MDYWIDSIGQLCNWNSYIKNEIITSCEGITLWENCYLIENTTELDLSGNNLSGNIPSEIGQLINLTWLNLGANQLTSIPPEIGNLTKLTALWLDGNSLTGAIPSEIGNLTNLASLKLSDNNLTGTIPSIIGNLTNIVNLQLNNNQLSGIIPGTLCNLTNLSSINLDGNNFCIPCSISSANLFEHCAFEAFICEL